MPQDYQSDVNTESNSFSLMHKSYHLLWGYQHLKTISNTIKNPEV